MKKKEIIVISSIIAIILACIFGWWAYAKLTVENISITINDKERVTTSIGGTIQSKFLVYSDGEVFENVDNIWHWKWNSSDIQGKLKKKNTYKVKVYGWRIPFLSSYRNIVEVY